MQSAPSTGRRIIDKPLVRLLFKVARVQHALVHLLTHLSKGLTDIRGPIGSSDSFLQSASGQLTQLLRSSYVYVKALHWQQSKDWTGKAILHRGACTKEMLLVVTSYCLLLRTAPA